LHQVGTSRRFIKLCLTEIRSGSLMFVVCLIGVLQRNFEPVVCVYVCVCVCVRVCGTKFKILMQHRF